jgi:hypothetical protein
MTSTSMTPETPVVIRVVDLVLQSPGIKSADVPKRLDISTHYAGQALTFASKAGLIRPVRVESAVFAWFPAGPVADAAERRWKAKAKARLRARNRLSAQRIRTKGQPEGVGRELADRPQCIRVKASAPLPFTCTAPASVFHLGGML